jgi:hypothetical protein
VDSVASVRSSCWRDGRQKEAHCIVATYLEILSVTVFAVALPFFGVTVTVTLHDPALRAFTPLPDTLQNLLDAPATLIAYFAPAGTFTFASASKVVFDAVLPGATADDTAVRMTTAPTVVEGTGAAVVGPVLLEGTVVVAELLPLDAGTVVTGVAAGTVVMTAGTVVATSDNAVATTLVRALGNGSQLLPAITLASTQ